MENLNIQKYVKVDHTTNIPLFGLDFLGILDRGTNVLEIKPNTLCNLKCKYCFVSAGDYTTNFVTDPDYLLVWIKKAIELKECEDLEIHLAPYGEIFLYPHWEYLMQELRKLPQVKVISLQSNGLLLTSEKILKCEAAGLDRLNLSLNSMNSEECADYCGVSNYDLTHLLAMFDAVLDTKMELLIAPVWFKGVNDEGIINIINYVLRKQKQGYNWPKLRLGIQNYLTYSTGRKIRKTRMREFKFFYGKLRQMEKEFGLKLKLGPQDFGIHKTIAIFPPVRVDDVQQVQILRTGRWKNEYIALLNEKWAVKLLSHAEYNTGDIISVKFVKSSLHGNLLTAIPAD